MAAYFLGAQAEQSAPPAIVRLTFLPKGVAYMKKMIVIGMAAGLVSLAACNSSPTEQAADNIEANAEAVADNMEDAADTMNAPGAEARLENQAEMVRENGQMQAEDMRTNDPDTNLSNGI